MARKPTYEELEQRIKALEEEVSVCKQTEELLRESEERYRDLFENAGELIQSVAPDGSLVYVNRSWCKTLGYDEEEVTSLSVFDVIHSESETHCEDIFHRVMSGENHDKIEAVFVTKNGEKIIVEGSISCKFEGDKPVSTRAIFRDITDRKKMEEKLRQLSYMDGLTGVANRRYFEIKLNREWRRASRDNKPISLVMADIDFFKPYNDTYGHLNGDDCLKQVANILSETLKRPADLVARYGGEEFAVILPNTGARGVATMAKAMRAKVEALEIEHTSSLVSERLTISLGVATTMPSRSSLPSELVSAADQALYQAKKEGRNKVKISDLTTEE